MYHVEVGDGVKDLITKVTEYLEHQDVEGMIQCLKKMTDKPEDIISSMPKFDCDEVLLYVDEKVTVYFIATTPKILYPPHEHGMVAISALYKGIETHVFYDRGGDNVIERCREEFEAPKVVDMTVDTVHAICNPGDEPNESLHFYLGNLEGQKRKLWDGEGRNPQQYIHEDYLSFSKPL